MASPLLWRPLGLLSRPGCSQDALLQGARALATGAAPSKKQALFLLNSPDPDAQAAVGAYLQSLFKGAKVEPTKPDDSLELTSKVEKKYMSALTVEYALQTISVPLGYSKTDLTPVKRYVSELLKLGAQAGFESPATEVSKRIAEQAQSADTVKELLGKAKSLVSPDLHTALLEAAAQVEAATGSPVTLDGGSKGYQLFAEKVKAIATASGIPWKTLVDVKKGAVTEEAQDKLQKDYSLWLQQALVKDAVAELEALKADAASVLDKHLGKTAEQVRKEQSSALASAIKRAEAAKGAPWAVQFLEDVKGVQWFDACVAENPAVGPKVSA